ncbi:diaminopimelate epimerase [Desulfurispira natronophila]|uniref:Diaminopimelate epimerase n=1 Tax=Desulfurispira natronophila TaxID=682562 RepID=A0A7W8DGK6_9BACT|nr:diaminopimelate epimerase [Desulfurispira natronophila]MBB5021510.1 diaminopimelate epimerase [Desulfurispira natronophila]
MSLEYAGWDGTFAKVTGTGNDFVVIDDTARRIDYATIHSLIPVLCHRNFGVGSDGAIFVQQLSPTDIRWHFYNADGSRAEMCGNGARCAARFVFERQLVQGRSFNLHTEAGIIRIQSDTDDEIQVELTRPKQHRSCYTIKTIKTEYLLSSINTGVPHAVLRVSDIESFDLLNTAPEIRFHEQYPNGTNVNIYERIDTDTIRVRTYERGVEGETLSCGTGGVAAAIIACLDDSEVSTEVRVITNGGELLISFDKELNCVSMKGEAHILFWGSITPELINSQFTPMEKEV